MQNVINENIKLNKEIKEHKNDISQLEKIIGTSERMYYR